MNKAKELIILCNIRWEGRGGKGREGKGREGKGREGKGRAECGIGCHEMRWYIMVQ